MRSGTRTTAGDDAGVMKDTILGRAMLAVAAFEVAVSLIRGLRGASGSMVDSHLLAAAALLGLGVVFLARGRDGR